MRPLTIARIRQLTRTPFRDGARTIWPPRDDPFRRLPGRSVEQQDREKSSALHKAMQSLGKAHCRQLGHRVFPRNVGLMNYENVSRFADFAIEKRRRVRLVECLTPWHTTSAIIQKKLQLAAYLPLDFICTRSVVRRFRRWGYWPVTSLGKFERSEIVYLAKQTEGLWRIIQPRTDGLWPKNEVLKHAAMLARDEHPRGSTSSWFIAAGTLRPTK